MELKENTPARISRRKYEETHRVERKSQYKVWGTSIDRKLAEEIEEFLINNKLSKVDLISAGFAGLKENIENKKE